MSLQENETFDINTLKRSHDDFQDTKPEQEEEEVSNQHVKKAQRLCTQDEEEEGDISSQEYFPTSPCYEPDLNNLSSYNPTSPRYGSHSEEEEEDHQSPEEYLSAPRRLATNSFRPYGLIFEDFMRELKELENSVRRKEAVVKVKEEGAGRRKNPVRKARFY